nr:CAP domain-containing protein [uncultured Psychrobacter sp.]
MMVSTLAAKRSSALLFSILFLAACGGGGDGGGSDSNTSSGADEAVEPSVPSEVESDIIVSDPIVSDSDTSVPDEPEDEQDDPVDPAPVALDNDTKAALVANNTISLARTSCGLNGLSDDTELGNVAIKHGNYIRHVYANSTPTSFNAHTENSISNIAAVTGNNNPFFGGVSFGKRLSNAGYSNVNHGVTENIAQTVYYSTADNIVASEVASLSMTKSLLAAPYHLRSLMMPGSSLTGSSMVAYEPFNKSGFKHAKGYVLVNHAAVTDSSKNNTVEGIFTYPCNGVTGTVTALYNESPNPFRNPNGGLPTRDLQKNPIGQPVYINMPSAQSIKVSNIKFRDMKRNVDIPVKLLDSNDDPFKGTNFELPANEAFIMPLTDSLKSCEAKRMPNQSQQCGLYGNNEYRVSFDVLVDGKDMQSKSFTFKTGKVSY